MMTSPVGASMSTKATSEQATARPNHSFAQDYPCDACDYGMPVTPLSGPLLPTNLAAILSRDGQGDQPVCGALGRVEVAAGVDEALELRLADRQAGGDRADTPRLFLEVPDEFAPGPFAGERAAVLGEDRDARAEQRAAHRGDQRDAAHQVEDFRRVGFAGAGLSAAQQRIAARHRAIGGEILGAADSGRVLDAAAREEGARILGLQPVDDGLDTVDLVVGDAVLGAERGRHIDMGDVVTGRRIDPVEGFEKDPVAPEASGDFCEVGVVVAGEAVAQLAAVVAGIGMVEAGLALQHRLAARNAMAAQGDGEQRVPNRAALA